jgi:hypothetical protein
MKLLLKITGRIEAGDEFVFRGGVRLRQGRIPAAGWFLSEQLRRHLQHHIMLGRVRMPNGVIVAWRVKAETQ